jgi:hypothetical protein
MAAEESIGLIEFLLRGAGHRAGDRQTLFS